MARMGGKRKGGKRGAAKPRRRMVRVPRVPRKSTVAEWASLTENKPSALLNTNQMYQAYNISLSQFPRAAAVAKAYQLYRIKRVTFKLSPLADTFSNSTTTVPYLYYMIDRTKNLAAANVQTILKRCGAIPRRLDDKIVSFSYTPNVLTGSFDSLPPTGQSQTQFTDYKIAPWLNTRDAETLGVWNPDTTDHLGIVWIVEHNGSAALQYKCETIVEFQFKKPSFEVVPSEQYPAPIEFTDIAEGL